MAHLHLRFVLSAFLFLWLAITMVTAADDSRYIITIDGGSSGSRIHIHKVAPPTKDQPVPKILHTVNKKIKPGLSSFEHNPRDVQGHVTGLIDFAMENIPSDKIASTPLYLKATAGLRSIPKAASDQILAVVRGNFAATPFLFEADWARIITGTEEGTFSWIAVNYLKGRFGQSKLPLLGVMEMGGASLQISYPLPHQISGEDVVQVHLDDTYYLYAHSFLGYGLDKAQELMATKNPESLPTCYPQGYNTDSITGRGDFGTCYSAMDSLMGKSACPASTSDSCTMNGKLMPNFSSVNFVAIENFFYTSEFLDIIDNFAAMPDKGREFCSRQWEDSRQLYPNEDYNDLTRYCFSTAFITAVMEKGFQIPLKQVEVARHIGDADIDWPVGSVIYDMMTHFPKSDGRQGKSIATTKNDEIQVFFLVAGFVLLTIAFAYQRKRKNARSLR